MDNIINLTIDNGVATLELNRPEVYNSFNREMALELQRILDLYMDKEDVRVILIKGSGKAFCAGQDLQEVTDPNGPELSTIVSEHFNPIIEKIRKIGIPVVTAVNGVAAGAGANIALAADICVATESASFIQAFSKIGLIPDSGGTYFLPRLIGFQKASAIMMLGDKISATEAERLGMIYKVFPDNEFEQGVRDLIHKMASMPTQAFANTKRALNQSMTNTLTEQLALEDELQTACGQTHDYNEGVSAFLEKRRPKFIGK